MSYKLIETTIETFLEMGGNITSLNNLLGSNKAKAYFNNIAIDLITVNPNPKEKTYFVVINTNQVHKTTGMNIKLYVAMSLVYELKQIP